MKKYLIIFKNIQIILLPIAAITVMNYKKKNTEMKIKIRIYWKLCVLNFKKMIKQII